MPEHFVGEGSRGQSAGAAAGACRFCAASSRQNEDSTRSVIRDVNAASCHVLFKLQDTLSALIPAYLCSMLREREPQRLGERGLTKRQFQCTFKYIMIHLGLFWFGFLV